MALITADRVREFTSTNGTGTFTLTGAAVGYQTFASAIGSGNTCYYAVYNPGVNEWEVGIGTVGSGTLARTTVLKSSNSNTLVDFSAGTKDVFVTYPAEYAVFQGGNFSGGTLSGTTITGTQVNITGQGDLRLEDTTGGEYVALQAPGTLASSYTLTMPVDDGTPGQALVTDGSGNLSWSTAASGDVYGPASATDTAVALFDGITGKLIKNSVVTIDGSGNVSGLGTVNATTLDLTNLEVTNIKAKDGTAAITLADSTGVATFSANPILNAATANGVVYANGSKVLTTGSALTFDGVNLNVTDGTNYAQLNNSGSIELYRTGNPFIDFKTSAVDYDCRIAEGSSGFNFIVGGSASPVTALSLTSSGNSVFNNTGEFQINSSSELFASIYRTSAGATNNYVGNLSWFGKNDAGSYVTQARYIVQQKSVVAGSETSAVSLQATRNGTSYNYIQMFGDSDVTVFSTSGGEGMRLTSTGLGIGTSSPSYKLDLTSSNDGYGRQWISSVGYPSSADNSAGFQIRNLGAGVNGIKFANYANNVEWMRLDSSGNLGLGVTPSAWSVLKAIQIGVTYGSGLFADNGGSQVGIASNAYYSSTGWKYFATGAASYTDQVVGVNRWFTAPSGTAGSAISFSQAMTLTASGNLLINTTSAYGTSKLNVNGDLTVVNGGGIAWGSNISSYTGFVGNNSTNYIASYTGGSERMRIDSSGNVGIGTSGPFGRLSAELNGGNTIVARFNSSNKRSGIYTAGSSGETFIGGNLTYSSGNIFNFDKTGTAWWVGDPGGAGNFYIGVANGTAGTSAGTDTNTNSRVIITSGGEVYIAGTTDRGAYNLQCNGTGVWGAGAYVNGSDAALKENVTTLDNSLGLINAMRPVTFTYKEDYSKDRAVQTGFIAQELQEVLAGQPYLDGIVQAGPEHLNVAYQNLIPLLVKAVQELTARVAQLEGN